MTETKVKRQKVIKLSLSDDEYDFIKQHSDKQLALFCREFLLNQIASNKKIVRPKSTSTQSNTPKKFHDLPKVDKDLLLQLSRIGNNLNQIARHLNTHKYDDVEQLYALSFLELIRVELEKIKTHYTIK